MNYSINIKGIHCSGCVGLIKMSLEELNLSEVVVNQDENKANFKSKKNKDELITILNKLFVDELKSYQYSNLNIIN